MIINHFLALIGLNTTRFTRVTKREAQYSKKHPERLYLFKLEKAPIG